MTSDSTWNRTGIARLLASSSAAVALVLACPGSVRGDEEGCLGCHGLPGFAVRVAGETRNLWLDAASLERSAHGEVECRECHGEIASIPHGETREVSCGQTCHGQSAGGKPYSHEGLYWEYAASVHGNARSPRIGCLVCHPEPARRAEAGRDKPREARRCAACHRGKEKVLAWFSDRHAVALAAGNVRAPSCPDCHGTHGVRSVGDKESPVSRQRLADTCANGALAAGRRGGCHGALTPAAAAGATMIALPGGKRPGGILSAALTGIAALLLAGLIARAGVGVARRR